MNEIFFVTHADGFESLVLYFFTFYYINGSVFLRNGRDGSILKLFATFQTYCSILVLDMEKPIQIYI